MSKENFPITPSHLTAMRSRLTSLIIVSLLIPFFLISCNVSDQKRGYTVHSSNEYGDKMVNKIAVLRAIPADSTIEIARSLRAEKKWKGEFVCYFYSTGLDVNSVAWVEVTYKADLSEANTKDKDGIPVKFEEIIPGIVWIEDLNALKTDKFDRKNLIREIPDILAKVKYEVYSIPGVSDKAIFVKIKPNGSVKVSDLKIRNENNIKKYVFTGPNIEGAFILDDTQMTLFDNENSSSGRTISYLVK